MTTIAYRDGILAGDSAWSDLDCDMLVSSRTKIERLRSGALYGAAESADGRELKVILQDVTNESELPLSHVLRTIEDKVTAILVLPNNSVYRIETGEIAMVVPIHAPFVAIGSGAKLAYGAMAHGATATEAVTHACNWDLYTKLPVSWLALDGHFLRNCDGEQKAA
jgi:hypothetical protein